MKIVVVIPTYNEKENIQKLIPVLDGLFKNSDLNFNVLIVDGNSPDGTFIESNNLAKNYKFLHAIKENNKSGLGSAYVMGITYAIKTLKADIVVEMDADFQHDPQKLIQIVTPIVENKADYVIGSRFTKGGSIPKDWAWNRKLLSVGGNLISKVILGIFNLTDFTSGYKASRVKNFLDQIDLQKIMSTGFAYKIDLLYQMYKLKAKIIEVPIVFGSRDKGDSKMEKNNTLDSLRVVIMLRIKNNKNFFKFVIVGFVGLFVDAGLFNFLRLSNLTSSYNGAIFSGLVAMLTTFILNNFWSFEERVLKISIGKFFGVIIYIFLGISLSLLGHATNTRVVLITTPITVLIMIVLDRLFKYKTLSFNRYFNGIINVLIYFMFSFFPVAVRSKLVYLSVYNLGDTFIITNLAFFIGIAFGLLWNFTIYNKIIWKNIK